MQLHTIQILLDRFELTPTEKTEYYNRICDPQEWDNKLPPVCPLNIYHGP